MTPTFTEIRAALRRSGPTLLVVAALAAAAICVLVVMHRGVRVKYGDMTRDPSIVNHLPLSFGWFSTLGGLLWAATAGICLLAARVARGRPDARRFFLASGAFTAWLMADDVYLLYDKVFPILLGVPETAIHVAYVVVCLTWLVVFRRRLLAADWPVLVVALGFFAASQGMDALLHLRSDVGFLVEDGAKFVGILAWAAFFLRTAAADLGGDPGAHPSP